MALNSVTIIWCCLIIGILLAISQVECKSRIRHSFSSHSKHGKYQYEVQNSVYDFPHGLNQNVTLDSDYITDCDSFIEAKMCVGATPICMSNGTIMCVASSDLSTPCPIADCVIFRDKQCKSTTCEKTFPCLVRLRKLVRDPITNNKVFDPPPYFKGLCVTLVAKPVRIHKS